jgi:hypothetical protein
LISINIQQVQDRPHQQPSTHHKHHGERNFTDDQRTAYPRPGARVGSWPIIQRTAAGPLHPGDDESKRPAKHQTVTNSYFETMRIPIAQGRAFQATDRIGTPVAIVNEAFARTFWKDLDPVGRHLRPRFGDQTPWLP